MEKPTKRTVAIPAGHGFKTRPLDFYHPTEVDSYIEHLEQRVEAAEAKLNSYSEDLILCVDKINELQAKLAELEAK